MAILNLASIRECTLSEGPGKRFAIWCQGCLKRCKGCCNESLQAIEKKTLVDVHALNQKILKAKEKHGIEGISLIGGEPFLQAKSLAKVAHFSKELGLSVLIFSGYTLLELQKMDDAKDLLNCADLLVDGPYIESLADQKRPWVGSTNQIVHRLTSFYPENIEFLGDRQMEILISNRNVFVNGWPYL